MSQRLSHVLHDPEANIESVGRPTRMKEIVRAGLIRAEGRALEHVELARAWRRRIGELFLVVPIGDSLPDVADHVVKAPRVRPLLTDHVRRRLLRQ